MFLEPFSNVIGMFTCSLKKENRRHERPPFWEPEKHTACCDRRLGAYYGTAQCFDTGGLACLPGGKMHKTILVIAGCRSSRAGDNFSFLPRSKLALRSCCRSCGGEVRAQTQAYTYTCVVHTHTQYCIWHLRPRRQWESLCEELRWYFILLSVLDSGQ